MRWTVKEKRYPCWNDRRIVKRFAFVPIRVGNEKRWLEVVYIKQRYGREFGSCSRCWINEEFVIKEDYDKREMR